ncbi:hypothetical protein RB623_20420 [Mesorhizobium sp. LHD-90]|uniref:hypothetical protein n=1 Tax=Mesorhizobium sp. LHD-90 TaxID=3071414 RepID=UPI0027E0C5F2|nr:hypothetical protein [Mesorhizobium sp. LHD-90]MDQ6436422.1 hypothetical protein [Mesorhizobium sp. LHD-90]
MSTARIIVLVGLLGVLLIDVGILFFSVYAGHEGLFTFGAEVGKVIFGAVVGALTTAFAAFDQQKPS